MSRAGSQTIEDPANERVFESLSDDRSIGDRVGTKLAQPFKVRVMQTKINGGLLRIGMAGIQFKSLELRDAARNRFAKIGGPEELKHGSRKCLVTTFGYPMLLSRGA